MRNQDARFEIEQALIAANRMTRRPISGFEVADGFVAGRDQRTHLDGVHNFSDLLDRRLEGCAALGDSAVAEVANRFLDLGGLTTLVMGAGPFIEIITP